MSLAPPIPPGLADISAALQAALAHVEELFDRTLRSELPPVQDLVEHVEAYRGKMLRPMLVILSGMAANPPLPEGGPATGGAQLTQANGAPATPPLGHSATSPSHPHTLIATVCEMIHMATLVHDDVLDQADTRRKGLTVNRLRGNEAAVILGDYLFSSAYTLCCTLPTNHAALLIGQTGITLCTGELLQLHHRDNLSLDEPTYFEIVRRKTASLIGVACRLGALASGASEADADRFARYGSDLGIAFQIQDDLLDLTGEESIVGKPVRRDLELGKLTLPLIHHLAAAPTRDRARTLLLLESLAESGATASDGRAAELLDALNTTGSIDHARAAARALVESAKSALAPIPDSDAKHTLLFMADQVVTRAF